MIIKAFRRNLEGMQRVYLLELCMSIFKTSVLMLVDEEGLIKNLPINVVASHFYGYQIHGQVIAGDAIFAISLGENMTGFGKRDSEQWMDKMLRDFPVLRRSRSNDSK